MRGGAHVPWACDGDGDGHRAVHRLQVGSYIFSFQTPKKYFKFLDLSSDRDEDVVAPEDGAPVPYEMRKLLPFTEPWTQLPDIERVRARSGQGLRARAPRARPMCEHARPTCARRCAQVTMLNRILETLWPTIAKAGVVQALQTAKTQLTGILAQVRPTPRAAAAAAAAARRRRCC